MFLANFFLESIVVQEYQVLAITHKYYMRKTSSVFGNVASRIDRYPRILSFSNYVSYVRKTSLRLRFQRNFSEIVCSY